LSNGGDGADQISFATTWQVGGGATTAVNLLGGRGGDTVEGQGVQHIAAGGRSFYNLDGGEGNDSLVFSYINAIVAGTLDLRMSGGAGDDTLTGILAPIVRRGGLFMASFDGGDGNDVIVGDVPPGPCEPGSLIDVSFLGSRGDDLIAVQVDLFGFMPESGRLRVRVDGGGGSDHMAFLLAGADRLLENALFTLDGEAGEDFAQVSAMVQIRNVEHVDIE